MDDAPTAYADAAVTMSRPRAADERVDTNWAAVGFAHDLGVAGGRPRWALDHDARPRSWKPLLILPMHRILDQPMIGKAVAAVGAGRVLPKTASAEEIRSEVRSLLQDPSYRHTAGVVSARLRSRNGAIAAADELESMLKARKDSARPAA
jgi:hypothetical protein